MSHNKKQSKSSYRKFRTFSIRIILISIVLIGLILSFLSSSAVQEARSVDRLLSLNNENQIAKFRPNQLSRLTPQFIQSIFGEKYFRTAVAATIDLSSKKPQSSGSAIVGHNQITIKHLSNLTNLELLIIDLKDSPNESLDFSPFERLEKLDHLFLSNALQEHLFQLTKSITPSEIRFCNCQVNQKAFHAIINQSRIKQLSFHHCDLKHDCFSSLVFHYTPPSLHLIDCEPIPDPAGSFSFKPFNQAYKSTPPNQNQYMKNYQQARQWLKKKYPNSSISESNNLWFAQPSIQQVPFPQKKSQPKSQQDPVLIL